MCLYEPATASKEPRGLQNNTHSEMLALWKWIKVCHKPTLAGLKQYLINKTFTFWTHVLQDMYQKFLDGDDDDDDDDELPEEQDPFWEPNEDVLIGTANVFLQSLG